MVAAAIIGAAVVGAGASAYSANKAAKTQSQAADRASQVQMDMYNMTRGDLAPYRSQGGAATSALGTGLGLGTSNPLTSPLLRGGDAYKAFMPTIAQLEQTPGYQFTKNQGLKAVQNSASARGLGISGAAQKGAAAYATGLADSTYQQNFDRYLTEYQTKFNSDVANQTNAFNRLYDVSRLGENAAANTGTAAASTSQSIGENIIGGANALAAGQITTGRSIGNAASDIGQAYLWKNVLARGTQGGGQYGSPT